MMGLAAPSACLSEGIPWRAHMCMAGGGAAGVCPERARWIRHACMRVCGGVGAHRTPLNPQGVSFRYSTSGYFWVFRGCRRAAEAKLRQLALRMNRSTLLAERRSRFLQAIRQTYNDFFHDYFINSSQIFRLRVRGGCH